MPLLSKRIFNCVKALVDVKPDEKIYTIPHTKEQLRLQEYPFKIRPLSKIQDGCAHEITICKQSKAYLCPFPHYFTYFVYITTIEICIHSVWTINAILELNSHSTFVWKSIEILIKLDIIDSYECRCMFLHVMNHSTDNILWMIDVRLSGNDQHFTRYLDKENCFGSHVFLGCQPPQTGVTSLLWHHLCLLAIYIVINDQRNQLKVLINLLGDDLIVLVSKTEWVRTISLKGQRSLMFYSRNSESVQF